MDREEGMKEIAMPTSTPSELEEERKYVLKKLDITEEEWAGILAAPIKTEADYPNSKRLIEQCYKFKTTLFGTYSWT